MPRQGKRLLAVLGSAAVLVACTAASTAQGGPEPAADQLGANAPAWVGTWAAAPAAGVSDNGYPNFSIRNVVHTSIGGSAVRVRLSNTFGRAPLVFGHVTAAVAEGPVTAKAVAGTMRELTFSGRKTITVPAGAEVLTDPVDLKVPADSDLLITTYVPTPSGPVTFHPAAWQTSFFTRHGDFADQESGAAFLEQTYAWHYVAAVDVLTASGRGSVLTLGDSITDGVGSTGSTNRRWPDYLADRLLAAGRPRLGVQNAGISANRLLLDIPNSGAGVNALARLDRDVLSRTGARTLIVLEGINDIQQAPHQTDPVQITTALAQLAERARARGMKVLGGTLTPFKGWNTYTEQLEAVRQAVNAFLRTSEVFDGVADFDAAIRDPQDPQKMKAEYDCGDHLHPGDAGFKAMAEAINLAQL